MDIFTFWTTGGGVPAVSGSVWFHSSRSVKGNCSQRSGSWRCYICRTVSTHFIAWASWGSGMSGWVIRMRGSASAGIGKRQWRLSLRFTTIPQDRSSDWGVTRGTVGTFPWRSIVRWCGGSLRGRWARVILTHSIEMHGGVRGHDWVVRWAGRRMHGSGTRFVTWFF